jgi:hypothetical protein
MAESFVNVTEGSGKKAHTNQRTIGANTVEDEYVVKGVPFFASYVVGAGSISAATANSHLLQLMAGASLNVYVTRIRVYQFGLATTAAQGRLLVFRVTTAGTGGGAITALPFDTSDAAAGAAGMSLPTVKGTEAAAAFWSSASQFMQTVPTGPAQQDILLDLDFNRDYTKPLRIPAGTANGIVIKCIDAIAAATTQCNIEFFEANY